MPLDTNSPNPETGRPETALYGWVYVATTATGCKLGITLYPDARRGW